MSIGERISALRKEQNISQAQLAQALDVSRQAVSKWENDMTSPDTLNLIKLADVLDTEVEYLATGVKRNAPPTPLPASPTAPPAAPISKPLVVVKTVEKEVPVDRIVERPVIRRVTRTKYLRNPIEYVLLGILCFVLGLLIGFFL